MDPSNGPNLKLINFLCSWMVYTLLVQIAFLNVESIQAYHGSRNCVPIFVRWPRVRLNFSPARQSPFALNACRTTCTNNEDPLKSGHELQCSAFNYRAGANAYTHECQLFTRDNVQYTDGYIEADDQYSFYWKYCVETKKACTVDHAFTFYSDRYMIEKEISRTIIVRSLEECLAHCLNEEDSVCRSVSFNRTNGGCYLSEQNQLTKPSLIKINNNPNFRIDYYENNCFNNSFEFKYECEEQGIRVDVDAKLPYTGALYGLYDFFSCRVEPKESRNFGLLFPYPTNSKNCSDSIRYSGNDIILEVVLSTDGVEPLYFITADDLTFQARCPINGKKNTLNRSNQNDDRRVSKENLKKIENNVGKGVADKSNSGIQTKAKTTTHAPTKTTPKTATTTSLRTLKPSTKDVFPLSQFNPTTTTATTTEKTTTTTEKTTTTTEKTTTTKKQPTITTVRPSNKNSKGMVAITDPAQLRLRSPQNGDDSFKHTTRGTLREVQMDSTERRHTATTLRNPVESRNFSFSTHLSFPAQDKISVVTGFNNVTDRSAETTQQTSTTTTPTTTTSSTTITTTTPTTTTSTSTVTSFNNFNGGSPPGFPPHVPTVNNGEDKKPAEAVMFDIFHNGQPTEAVVVGSRITLSFTPYLAIPPSYMSISGCQVEPIDSQYEWEKEPLAIVKDGCQADHVGLVCPPQRTDYGIRVTVESFRYQTTSRVQYTCLVRICSFAECPITTCSPVEGCASDDLFSRSLGLNRRVKRELSLEQIQAALAANPLLQQQLEASQSSSQTIGRMNSSLQLQLLNIGGDHIVRKRLVVVNTEDDLRYYIRTGQIPPGHLRR